MFTEEETEAGKERLHKGHMCGGTYERQDSNGLLKSRQGRAAHEFAVSPREAQVHPSDAEEDQLGCTENLTELQW